MLAVHVSNGNEAHIVGLETQGPDVITACHSVEKKEEILLKIKLVLKRNSLV